VKSERVSPAFLFLILLTSMFHYRIAILHGKSFLLQSLVRVTPINAVCIHCQTAELCL